MTQAVSSRALRPITLAGRISVVPSWSASSAVSCCIPLQSSICAYSDLLETLSTLRQTPLGLCLITSCSLLYKTSQAHTPLHLQIPSQTSRRILKSDTRSTHNPTPATQRHLPQCQKTSPNQSPPPKTAAPRALSNAPAPQPPPASKPANSTHSSQIQTKKSSYQSPKPPPTSRPPKSSPTSKVRPQEPAAANSTSTKRADGASMRG